MRQILCIIGIFFLIFLLAGCMEKPGSGPDEKTIITSVTGQLASIHDYTAAISVDRGADETDRYHIFVRYPGEIRADVIASQHWHPGSILILSGSTLIESDPTVNTTTVLNTDPGGNLLTALDFPGLLKRILVNGTATFSGTVNTPGGPRYAVEFVPGDLRESFDLRYSDYRFDRAILYADTGTFAIKEIALYDSGGKNLLERVEYQDLSINPGIPDDTFRADLFLLGNVVTEQTHPPTVFDLDHPNGTSIVSHGNG